MSVAPNGACTYMQSCPALPGWAIFWRRFAPEAKEYFTRKHFGIALSERSAVFHFDSAIARAVCFVSSVTVSMEAILRFKSP